MRIKASLAIVTTVICAALLRLTPVPLEAQGGAAALTGVVSSEEEGKMEGVVVTARREGAIFSVSVVSDAQGRYSFPRSHVEPGTYALTMRATGYDLADPGTVDVAAGKTATLDLSLKKTADLSKQLSSREWALSMPGPEDMRDKTIMAGLSCVYCHSIERVVKSKHTADEFVPVITRMLRYFADGSATPTGTGRANATLHEKAGLESAEKTPFWASPRRDGTGGIAKADLAQYLASVNLSGGRTQLTFALKTLPRPKGQATRVIVTTWDMPRKNAVSHDSDADPKGNLWYNEENENVVGMLNPRTNTFTEYPLEPVDKTVPGARDIMVDKQGNVWLTMRVPGNRQAFYKFEPATRKFTLIEGTVETAGAFGGVSPDGSHAWGGYMRVDAKTGRLDGDFRKPPNLPEGQQSVGYGFAVTSKGNPCGTDFGGSRIYCVDVVKNEGKFWPTLRPGILPRRGRIDAQDRFWFGLYGGDAIGMFDTRTEKMTEWKVPIKYTTPYTATIPDANGYVYASSNTSERVLRLDPKTGEVVEYPMPAQPGNFDTKKMSLDPTTKKTVILFANTRNAQVMRVEPLD